jgi:DNA-binding YbaB/EbfC family protein
MNFAKMMKQAQQMQSQAQKLQEEVGSQVFEGTTGGGVVKVKATGDGKLTEVTIAPELLKDGDVDMLQDLVLGAANSALDQGREAMAQKMRSLTAGLGLPGM